jgi:CBS domain-containing protein
MKIPSFKIGDIATYDLSEVFQDELSDNVHELMKKNDFTSVTVVDDNNVTVGYVTQDTVRKQDDIEVGKLCTKMSKKHIIDEDCGFIRTLEKLNNNEFYFIGAKSDVRAIVTRADLNSKPMYRYLFARMLAFEDKVDNYIQDNIEAWKTIVASKTEREIKNRYLSSKKEDVHLKEIEYADFSTKLRILYRDEKTRGIIGYDDADSINAIIHLYEDVCSRHPIIHSESKELDINHRYTEDLVGVCKSIHNIEDNL